VDAPPVHLKLRGLLYIEIFLVDMFDELVKTSHIGFGKRNIVFWEWGKGDLCSSDKISAVDCLQPGKPK